MKMKVQSVLQYGKENAISSDALVELLGLGLKRNLQKQIASERAAGAVILTDFERGGYFLSNDPDELKEFIHNVRAKAANTMKAARPAEMALDAATGQERVEGWFDA